MLIKQRNNWDCGVAALATLLRVDYDTAGALLKRDPSKQVELSTGPEYLGIAGEELSRVLFYQRLVFWHLYPEENYPKEHEWIKMLNHYNLEQCRTILCSGMYRCLVRVPSLRFNADHWIVVSGGKVYDPSTKIQYQDADINSLDIRELFILRLNLL